MSVMGFAQALHGLVEALDAAAEELLQADFGITHSQLAFLMPLLREGELDVSSLAARNRVTLAAVSKRISWFVDRGLVRAGHPVGDAKRVVLTLTPKGRRLAGAASARLASGLDELLDEWPVARRDALLDLALDVTAIVHRNRGRNQKESA